MAVLTLALSLSTFTFSLLPFPLCLFTFQGAQSAARPSTFDDLTTRAAAAHDKSQLEEALTLYRKALAARPKWDEGRWYEATLLYELDRHAEAKDAFSEVLRREPAHAGALGLRGLCEFEIANQMLTEFVADGTDTPQVIEAFGLNVLRMPMLPSEFPPAEREQVLMAGHAGYAMAARLVGPARIALDDLLARFPKIPHAHYARGVFFLTEDSERALDDFRRELEISPSHVPARLQIAFEYLKRGDAAQALPAASEAAKLAPDHFAARLALGQVLLEMNDLPRALPELEKAAALAPGSPQAQFLLARAYTRAGRPADAERARAEFTRLDQIVRTTRQGSQAVGGIPSAGSSPRHP